MGHQKPKDVGKVVIEVVGGLLVALFAQLFLPFAHLGLGAQNFVGYVVGTELIHAGLALCPQPFHLLLACLLGRFLLQNCKYENKVVLPILPRSLLASFS